MFTLVNIHGLNLFFILITLLLQTSCSSTPKTVLLGSAIGAGTGGAIGSQTGKTESGAAFGALLGAGLSYLILKSNDKKTNTKILSPDKLELDDAESPFLKSPKVRKYWQNDKIEGRRFIKGHWIYEIEEQPTWMQ
jgi:hypothetical protein